MKIITASLLVVILAGSVWADPPASQPSKLAAERAGMLKADVKTFMLSLDYHGKQDKPYYRLLLSVSQVPVMEKAPFTEVAQITKDEATAIIDHLAVDGFLDKALDGNRNKGPVPPDGPNYTLTVRVENNGNPVVYQEWLGWNLKMLERLDELRKVLGTDAVKGMDGVLARMSGYRREWEQQATTQPDIAKLIADLSSDNGKVRIAATKTIFALGKDALEPLAKAGAKQITPLGPATGRRIDMVYSLLDGFKPNPVNVPRGYHAEEFKVIVEKGCTVDEVKKMGERQGFTIPQNFALNSHAFLGRGKNLAETIKAILTSEPQVITVNLSYFEIMP